MEFSLHIQTRIKDWEIIKELELMGYDSVWVPDTQMMWSDCYSTMALAAQNTDKNKNWNRGSHSQLESPQPRRPPSPQ